MAFKIQIKKFNLDNNQEYYSVSKIMLDESVIAVLEAKFDGSQIVGSDNGPHNLEDDIVHGSVSNKDCVSSIGDNLTPVSALIRSEVKLEYADVAMAASENVTNSGIKRNLGVIYDVEDDSTPCSSKSRAGESISDLHVNLDDNIGSPKVDK